MTEPNRNPAEAFVEIDRLKKRLHELESDNRTLKNNNEQYRFFFDKAGVSLWLYDFGEAEEFFDALTGKDEAFIRNYLTENQTIFSEIISKIKLVDVNDKTVELYGASSREEIIQKVGRHEHPESRNAFMESTIAYLSGKSQFRSETVNETVDGRIIHVILEITYPFRERGFKRAIVAVVDITDLKLAEKALSESEEKHRLLSHLSSDYLYAAKIGRNNIYYLEWVEGAFERITGYSRDEINVMEKTWGAVIHHDDRESLAFPDISIPDNTCREAEYRIISKSGEIKWLHDKCTLSLDENGEYKIIGAVHDITGRILRDKLRTSLEKVREAVWTIRQSSDIKYVGNAIRNGLLEQNIRFDNFGIQLFSQDFTDFRAYLIDNDNEWRELESRDGAPLVKRFLHEGKTVYRRDLLENDEYGELKLINNMYTPQIRSIIDVPFSQGTIALNSGEADAFSPKDISILEEMAGLLSEGLKRIEDLRILENRTRALENEIEERKKAEAELKLSEEKYRDVVDNLPETVYEFDLNGTLTFASRNGFRFFRYTGEDFARGLNVSQMVAPEDRERVRENIGKILQGANLGSNEYTAIRKDGSRIPVLIHSTRIVKNDRPVGMRAIIIDISERKEAEKAIRESEEKYRTLVERANDGVIIVQDGKMVFVNAKLTEILGYQAEEMLNQSFLMLLSPDYTATVSAIYKKRLESEKVPDIYEVKGQHKDGRSLNIEVNSGMITYNGREAVMSFIRDITESKRLEEQLLIRERMDSLGTLAGGIAHDFNNLLSGIVGNLDLLRMDRDMLTAMQAESVDEAYSACERAAKLIRNFQVLSHGSIDTPTTFDLYEVVSEVFAILNRTTDRIIEKRLEIEPGFIFINGIPDQIHQVFLNLGTNAIQAIEEKGAVSGDFIRLAVIEDESDPSRSGDTTQEEKYVHIVLEDSGCGMSEEVRHRAFEPFFSTKERGVRKGQGLGLAMVYNIISSKHRGKIEIESSPGKGTTFHIFLQQSEAAVKAVEAEINSLEGGTETILIIDDEESVRLIIEKSLRRFGYNILTAADGEEGLGLYKASANSIDMVLLDLTMPKMSGQTVLDEIMKANPAAKVILLSGLAKEEISILKKAAAYITKPYAIHDLIRTIRTVLDGKKNLCER